MSQKKQNKDGAAPGEQASLEETMKGASSNKETCERGQISRGDELLRKLLKIRVPMVPDQEPPAEQEKSTQDIIRKANESLKRKLGDKFQEVPLDGTMVIFNQPKGWNSHKK